MIGIFDISRAYLIKFDKFIKLKIILEQFICIIDVEYRKVQVIKTYRIVYILEKVDTKH